MAIDILGPLTRTTTGHRYTVVVTDRFSKLTWAIALRSIGALPVAKALVKHCILVYGPPATILSDNSTQFTSKLFQFVCTELRHRFIASSNLFKLVRTDGLLECKVLNLFDTISSKPEPCFWNRFIDEDTITWLYLPRNQDFEVVVPYAEHIRSRWLKFTKISLV